MISKEAIKRGYNRGNYTVGAPTQPYFADPASVAGDSSLQTDPVSVAPEVVEELRGTGAEVKTSEADVIAGTRDWWARTMIAETSGAPATPVGVIVEVEDVDQVVAVMKIAAEHKVPVTASAGRSNVTGSALPLRGGIVLDVCKLNQIISVDAESQIVDVQAGMFLDLFEAEIQSRHGLTAGNWPSSFGLATVGGQVACRGAGQLSTRDGKIEDMVWSLDMVLANGDLVTVGGGARGAVGPDLKQPFIGSEGTLGIIVSAKIMCHRLPDYEAHAAYGFPTFAAGLDACRRILQLGATPAVLRLYDNLESGVQFDLPDTNVLLIADEGTRQIVDAMMDVARQTCAETGTELDSDAIMERWMDTRYLTGKSAEGFKKSPGFVADTLEMTGAWADLPAIYDEVVEALVGVPGTLAGSAHQSHAYTSAGCLYFSLRGDVEVADRADWYRAAWDAANAVVIKHGATLSHHHGVGLLRAPYMADSLGSSFQVLTAVKRALDPDNLLNPLKLGLG